MKDRKDVSMPGQDENEDSQSMLYLALEKTGRVERWTEWLSERFNPILVKETRQVLKSRQFIWTFFLLLAAVVIWAVVGALSFQTTDEMGPGFLYGYLMILGFPLGIIVPFSTFRSLVNEFDDGTISLIMISSLKGRQIVLGKLGSAVIQMMVYLAILAPCIVFTYLLFGSSAPRRP